MKKILIALMGLLLCGCATRGYVDQRIELVRFQNECNLKSQYADGGNYRFNDSPIN